MTDYVVAETQDLDEDGRLNTELRGREIGIFKIDGDLYAYTSWCAHQSGPICEGDLGGTAAATFDKENLETTTEWVKDGKVLRCPWHNWEYDVESGESISKDGVRLPSHEVREEDGEIVVTL